MARIGNRIAPGRYTLGSWKDLSAQDAQIYLEQQIIATERITVVRCVYRPGSDFPAHFHPREQITIVEQGALQFLVEGDEVEVRAGQMISIPAGVKHATRMAGEERACALNLFLLSESEGPGGPGGSVPPSVPPYYRR